MSWSELFLNFLRMWVKDFVRELLDEALEACCVGVAVAQNRSTSIQASHPMEIGSVRR
jgi:hypothetical protein